MLNQESRKLGLCDHGELWISAADVPFPVGVLRQIGCLDGSLETNKKANSLVDGNENGLIYLWWLGWNISPVENREGVVGS